MPSLKPSASSDLALGCGIFVKVERHGHIVACCEYDWVKDWNDLLRADRGDVPQGGDVLYVSNLRVNERDPSLMWELKRLLPNARWIVGLTEEWELRAPKGVPDDFYAAA